MSSIWNDDETALWSGNVSDLDQIEIHAKGVGFPLDSMYNAVPLLQEVRHALHELANSGESATIDLSSIPSRMVDRQHLFETLGKEEVDATIRALSPTHIRETAGRGVWPIEHHSPRGGLSATHIGIVRLPNQQVTPEADVDDATFALEAPLNA